MFDCVPPEGRGDQGPRVRDDGAALEVLREAAVRHERARVAGDRPIDRPGCAARGAVVLPPRARLRSRLEVEAPLDGVGALVLGSAESPRYTCIGCRQDAGDFALGGAGPRGRRVPPPLWMSFLLGAREAARSRCAPSDNGGRCKIVLCWHRLARSGEHIRREDRVSGIDPVCRRVGDLCCLCSSRHTQHET